MHLLHTETIVGSSPTLTTKQCPRSSVWTRASRYEREGRRFESFRGRQFRSGLDARQETKGLFAGRFDSYRSANLMG